MSVFTTIAVVALVGGVVLAIGIPIAMSMNARKPNVKRKWTDPSSRD